MKVRNIMKKIAVLGASTAMLGATVMGAMAYDLSSYPAQFIVDGNFNGKIVVGEKAATSDVLGAIDIAASLQADSVTQEAVDIPGMAGQVDLKGDVFRIETSSDLLEMREPVGEVYDTLTDSELDALRGGSITTDEGNTDYNQYVRFADSSSTELQKIAVNYDEDESNVLGDYLVIDDNKPFFEWEIEFTEGLESSTDDNQLEDLEDEVFNIFGTDFTFVDSSITTSGSDAGKVTLDFMGGDVGDTLKEGETKTYTIDGVDYEVTAVFISDPNDGNQEAKFAVNGELTDSLKDGETDTLSNGMQIGVRDLLVNSRDGVVEFFLGANKIEFTDSTTSSESFDGKVEVSNENIEDADIAIIGDFTSSDNSTYEITNIKYRLTADASLGSTVYVPAGHGIAEYLDEPEGMLSPTFDIKYEGLKDVKSNDFKINAKGDDSYDITLTNLRGKEYNFPLINNKNGVWSWGDDDDDFIFTESNPAGGITNLTYSNGDFPIGDNDYFVVSEGTSSSNSEKDDSAVLRYEDIDTSDKILTFTDMSTGDSKTVSYSDTSSAGDAIGIASNFVVEGNSYTIYIGNKTNGYPLAVDVNGDGNLNGAISTFTIKGGGVLSFDSTSQAVVSGGDDLGNDKDIAVDSGTVIMSLSTPANQFDDSTLGGDQLNWSIVNRTNEEVGLSIGDYSGPLESNSSDPWGHFDMVNDNSDDDYDRGITDYGAFVEYYNPSGSQDAEELTIHYPEAEKGAQVFVTAGTVSRSSSSAGVTRDVVNPIGLGIAELDKDVTLGDSNMIIVGGPCANTVAFDFLGQPANCAEGFEAGKATIMAKEINGNVAILVAGYEAQETLGASYVLADYSTYLSDVSGSEVEVIASDLSNLQVTTPVAAPVEPEAPVEPTTPTE